jgi:hypothetical protein
MSTEKKETRGQAIEIMQIAGIWATATNNESSKLCVRDAASCFYRHDYRNARLRAINSLAHSVGVFHRAYISATILT